MARNNPANRKACRSCGIVSHSQSDHRPANAAPAAIIASVISISAAPACPSGESHGSVCFVTYIIPHKGEGGVDASTPFADCHTMARLNGAQVTVRDPAALGDNASGVAAGMLAPASEAALDPVSADHFELLKTARDLWPALAERVGFELDQSGAAYLGEHVGAVAARMRAMGAKVSVYGHQLLTPEDWRLSPRIALAALKAAAERGGVRFEALPAEPPAPGE